MKPSVPVNAERAAASRVVNIGAVCALTSLSRGTVYNYVNAGLFPRQVPLGRRRVGWREAEVLAWLENRQSLSTAA